MVGAYDGRRAYGRDVGTGRVEAFSDGVLAIAITLLVLDVKVPVAGPGRLAHALVHEWPTIGTYAVSFAIIGIIWVNHHALFDRIARVNRPILFLNLFLLMAVAFLPFPTALLAAYVDKGGPNSHAAAAVYAATMSVVGLSFLGFWLYLARTPAVRVASFTDDDARAALRRTVVGPVVYLSSVVVAFVSAPACLVMYAFVAVFFAMPGAGSATTPGEDPAPARR